MENIILSMVILALIKIFDNLLLTYKSLVTYQNKKVLSSFLVILSQAMFYLVIKQVMQDSSILSITVVAISSGIGTYIAFAINDRFQKDVLYMNIITCGDIQWMFDLNDYLVSKSIKCVLNKSLTRGKTDTYSLTIFANTKEQSKTLDKYLKNTEQKFLRQIVK